MKSLITGWAGFLGSHLADYLLAEWHEVVILDNLSGWFERNIPDNSVFYCIDFCDKQKLSTVFAQETPDYVFHLWAYAAEWLSHFIRNYNYTNNLIGSVNIINECIKHKVKRLVFTSSMAVYGTNQVPYKEDMIPSPEDPYGTAKYAVEQDLEHAHRMFGLEYTIFRPHNIVGTRQHIGDTFRNVVGIFVNQVMQGKPMTIFGDWEQTRAFSYVKDIVPYIATSITNHKTIGKVYNIGWEVPYTINQLSEKIQSILWGTIVHEPPRYEVKHAHSNHDRLYEDFGHLTEQTPFDYVLDEMIVWAKELWPQEPTKFGNIELTENLPPKRVPYVE